MFQELRWPQGPEKFYNVELREKGEDVIAKPLTKSKSENDAKKC